jgi:hypothetical protein
MRSSYHCVKASFWEASLVDVGKTFHELNNLVIGPSTLQEIMCPLSDCHFHMEKEMGK